MKLLVILAFAFLSLSAGAKTLKLPVIEGDLFARDEMVQSIEMKVTYEWTKDTFSDSGGEACGRIKQIAKLTKNPSTENSFSFELLPIRFEAERGFNRYFSVMVEVSINGKEYYKHFGSANSYYIILDSKAAIASYLEQMRVVHPKKLVE